MALSRIMGQVRHWGLRRALYHWFMRNLQGRLTLCHVLIRPVQREPDYPPLSEGRQAGCQSARADGGRRGSDQRHEGRMAEGRHPSW